MAINFTLFSACRLLLLLMFLQNKCTCLLAPRLASGYQDTTGTIRQLVWSVGRKNASGQVETGIRKGYGGVFMAPNAHLPIPRTYDYITLGGKRESSLLME